MNLSYPPGASRDGGSSFVSHLGNGKACTMDGDCASGHCNDKFCCKTDVRHALLHVRASPGNEGVCMVAPAGMNPRSSCTDNGAANCANDGVCDGAGACQNYAAGTICQAPSCLTAHQEMLASSNT